MRATQRERKAGFTMVEIMIVVGIIGMIAAVAIPSFVKSRRESRIARMMNDPHPAVRRTARDALLDRAGQGGQKKAIITIARTYLAGKNWRAKEHAALILGQLDDKASADKLVELLNHRQAEVFIAAAWALRKLAVPATLPAMLKRVNVVTAGWLKSTVERAAHECGQRRHLAGAEPLFGSEF